jgi:pimeloyl-ACP methyl ester carboxylesterase
MRKRILVLFIPSFFLFFLMNPFDNVSQPLSRPFGNSHFMTVDSIRFHYRTWNETLEHPRGKVLLVHGFCGSTFCWRYVFDTLVSQGFRVVAVDLPGFGYSERNAAINQSQSNRARLIWDLLDRIDGNDTTPWNIVGHSMGGGAVEAMALMDPGRVKNLVAVDGLLFAKNKNMQGAFITLSRKVPYNKVLVSFAEKNMITFNNVRRGLKKVYGRYPDTTEVQGYLDPLLIEGSAASVVSVWSNSKEVRHLNIDHLKRMPVLLIWGKKDRTIPLRYGKRFKREVPVAELKIIPDASHSPMETHPDKFNPILLEFLLKKNNP